MPYFPSLPHEHAFWDHQIYTAKFIDFSGTDHHHSFHLQFANTAFQSVNLVRIHTLIADMETFAFPEDLDLLLQLFYLPRRSANISGGRVGPRACAFASRSYARRMRT